MKYEWIGMAAYRMQIPRRLIVQAEVREIVKKHIGFFSKRKKGDKSLRSEFSRMKNRVQQVRFFKF